MSRPETVTVLAGGWSAKAHLHRAEGTVIAVNDAALHAPCHIALSMDRLWLEHRWQALWGRAGFTSPALLYGRRSALKNLPAEDWIVPFDCDHESTVFADAPGRLNGTHSGFCALNLAYQLRPERLVMIGFDMGKGPSGQAHWYPDYPWAKPGGATSSGKFAAWARQFEGVSAKLATAGILVEVYGETAIPAFKRRA